MRQFVERTNGNMRAFASSYKGAWWSHTWDQYLPTMLDSGGTDPDFAGVYQELGPYVHPPGASAANEGCYVNGYGARTYRLPDEVNTRMGDQQYYSQDILDEKALNCVDAYIIAAFCAWDGGRLPTRAEWNAAWGAGTYPWAGSTPPAGWPDAFDSDATGMPFTPTNGDVKLANFAYNYWGPANKISNDYSLYISPPGRFPKGNGPKGHADLAGSVFNFLAIAGTSVGWSKSGSWQGHQIPWPNADASGLVTNKYWAAGGRCAR
jgi:formylglycine-generating enzyme required for sulfatase activity